MRNAAARIAVLSGAAFAQIAACASAGGAQQIRPTPTPAACARPNVAASVLRAVLPETPPMAEGIQGVVQVVVSLDENSRVVWTRIQSSPSALLNATALAAARQSTFRTEVRDCRPIAGDYIYAVDFQSTVTFSISEFGERTISAVGAGTVRRAADVAYVQANIVTREDVAADAVAKNDAAFGALNAKLAAAGLAMRAVRDIVSLRSESGYRSTRYVEIAVDHVANAGRAAAAVSSAPSVVVSGIRFSLRDVAPAQRDALDLAVRDAEKSVRDVATAQHLRLGVVRQVIVPPADRTRPPIAVVPFRLVPVTGGFTEPPIRVPDLEVHASATVTYALKS